MFVAWLGTIILCALQLSMVRYGAGVNVWEIPEVELETFDKVRHPKGIYLGIQLLYPY